MPLIRLGSNPEALEAEQAAAQKALELEVQQREIERANKLAALYRKQKITKILIFTVFGLICAVLIVFGTYNTFIKQPLTKEEVDEQIITYLTDISFPTEGLSNYLRDNCTSLFNKYMSLGPKGSKIAKISVDKDSCYIEKVTKLNQFIAQVYFSVDVSVTEKDTQVTDPALIDRLKKNGFQSTQVKVEKTKFINNSAPAPSKKTEAKKADETTEEQNEEVTPIETENSEDITEIPTDDITEIPTEVPTEIPTEAPTPTVEPVAEVTDVYQTIEETETPSVVETINYKIAQDTNRYYLLQNGVIMQEGKTTTKRYTFYLPIMRRVQIDNDIIVADGYKPCGEMNLYSLNDIDQTDFEKIDISSTFAFDEQFKVTPDELNKMQVKVDKILDDLYNKEDTQFDFLNFKTFNTYDAKYEGIRSLKAYTVPNQYGFNAYVSYTITTTQGFSYLMNTYLVIEKNGTSYVIKEFL